ncbi:MAG: hypothetical protein JWM10_4097 [Myxococcaceae bacterium]|nr:hypothetical protein [Myxococcaceae bacterium]
MNADARILPVLFPEPYEPTEIYWGSEASGAFYDLVAKGRLPRHPRLRDLMAIHSRELTACRRFGAKSLERVRLGMNYAGLTLLDDAPDYTIEQAPLDVLLDMLPVRRGPRGAR